MAQFLAKRWRQQPQGSVNIDWGNPLTRDLYSAVNVGDHFRDSVSSRFSTGSRSFRAFGTTRVIISSTLEAPIPASLPTKQTLLWCGFYRSSVLSGYEFATVYLNPLYGGLQTAASRSLFGYFSESVGADRTVTSDPDALKVEAENVVSARFGEADGIAIFANNRKVGNSASYTAGAGITYGPALALSGGAFSSPNAALGCAWRRLLTDAEILALHENPWQIFAARRPIIYSLPGPTGPVLSAATAIDIGSTSARPRVTLNI